MRKIGGGEGKYLSEKENVMMVDRNTGRHCEDRARILDSKFANRQQQKTKKRPLASAGKVLARKPASQPKSRLPLWIEFLK